MKNRICISGLTQNSPLEAPKLLWLRWTFSAPWALFFAANPSPHKRTPESTCVTQADTHWRGSNRLISLSRYVGIRISTSLRETYVSSPFIRTGRILLLITTARLPLLNNPANNLLRRQSAKRLIWLSNWPLSIAPCHRDDNWMSSHPLVQRIRYSAAFLIVFGGDLHHLSLAPDAQLRTRHQLSAVTARLMIHDKYTCSGAPDLLHDTSGAYYRAGWPLT